MAPGVSPSKHDSGAELRTEVQEVAAVVDFSFGGEVAEGSGVEDSPGGGSAEGARVARAACTPGDRWRAP